MENERAMHWRCKQCGKPSPVSSCRCVNPGCGADLNLYGEIVFDDAQLPPPPPPPPPVNVEVERVEPPKTAKEPKPPKQAKKPKEPKKNYVVIGISVLICVTVLVAAMVLGNLEPDDNFPGSMATDPTTFTELTTENSNQSTEDITEAPTEMSNEAVWQYNYLMRDPAIFSGQEGADQKEEAANNLVLGSQYKRRQIATITIVDTLINAPADAWDVSVHKNGTVVAWVELNGSLYDLYIGGEGGVNADECGGLFAGYQNVTEINFNNCFHTEETEDMSVMFYACTSLTDLDLSGFDTSQVQDMSEMFERCENLTELDVSGFDTSQVQDMSFIFYDCYNLTELDVSGFDTSQVQDMPGMFHGCEKLTELDVSNFDTSQVQDMSWMFCGCENLTKLDVSGFDTSQVQDMSWMFYFCENLTELELGVFDTSNINNFGSLFFMSGDYLPDGRPWIELFE